MSIEERPNWVALSVQCRMQNTFRDLLKVVKQDVNEMNEQVAAVLKESIIGYDLRPCKFIYEAPVHAIMYADPRNYTFEGMHVLLEFDSHKNTITVTAQYYSNHDARREQELSKTQFTIEMLQWDKKAQTYLPCIEGEPYQLWEVSQKALEPLFFLARSEAPRPNCLI